MKSNPTLQKEDPQKPLHLPGNWTNSSKESHSRQLPNDIPIPQWKPILHAWFQMPDWSMNSNSCKDTHHDPGHTTVLKNLTEAIITQQHTPIWTLTKHTTNWNTRIAITEETLQRYPGILPPELNTQPTWILTEQTPELIRAISSTTTVLRTLSGL